MSSNDKRDKDDYCTNCVGRVDFYLNLEIIERIRENGAETEATTASFNQVTEVKICLFLGLPVRNHSG